MFVRCVLVEVAAADDMQLGVTVISLFQRHVGFANLFLFIPLNAVKTHLDDRLHKHTHTRTHALTEASCFSRALKSSKCLRMAR